MPDTINILLKNTTTSNLYAYITGRANDALCLIQADGRTQYYPRSPGGTLNPLEVDCSIYVGTPGATKTVQVPHLSASRIWFSLDQPLTFFLNPGPALVEPSVTNPSDPNINKAWGFCEFTFNAQQIYANISYVDFVSIPIAMSLTNVAGQTQSVKGIPRNALDKICQRLADQHAIDGAGWNELIVKTPSGQNLRALSPNLGLVVKPWLFNGYYEPYVSQVWEKFKTTQLSVDTQSSFGSVNGKVVNEVLDFPGLASVAKPSTGDIFSCSTGSFQTNTEALRALTPRIAAAFNRSTIHTGSEPADPSLYYKSSPTNHYSRILHETNLDGRGYGFPYDDVKKSGSLDQSGSVFDPNPVLLSITVGGESDHPAISATSHIRAENFDVQNGVKTEPTSDVEAGNDVGWISNGDWMGFFNIDFGSSGLNSVSVRVASGQGGGVTGNVEFRLDSQTGPILAIFVVGNTGGWQSWTTVTEKMFQVVTGIHSVYLTFASGSVEDFVNVNWFTFDGGLIPQGNFKTVGYYVNWAIYARNYQPQDIPANQLTHINYAFANVRPDGTVFLTDSWADTDKHYPTDSWNDPGNNVYGCIKQLFLLKKMNRYLKVLLSIGGWSYAGSFPSMASSPDGRSQFARSAVQLVQDCGFDGIDIDWEYPSDDGQAQNFVDLLRELRAQLDAYSAQAVGGYRFLITVACPAGPSNYQKLHVRDMDNYLDFWNLMAYDMAGSWDQTAGHQANIYKSISNPVATPFCADDAINNYIANGLPSHKLVLGMPLYGRAFLNTNGPGSPYNGIGAAEPPGSWEAGVWDYKALPRPGAAESFDPNIIASWSYDGSNRMMVTYDTVDCERKKCDYIRQKDLGGAMWWETSGDRKDDHSLIAIVAGSLGGGDYGALDKAENCLNYPLSKYDNIRNGLP